MASRHISDYPPLQKVLEAGEKIVYLCGAGASMSLGEHQNSWSTWLYAGRSRLLPAQQAAFDALAGSSASHELIAAASYLLDSLKADDGYTGFMDETIGSLHPSNAEMAGAFQKICRAGDLTATTNYDLLIEQASGSHYVTYEKPGEILSIINGMATNRVIHLHGVYDRKCAVDNIVADGKQYRTILENVGAQFIQNLLSTHPIIIVGCGGTISDPNLSGFMQFVIDKLGLSVPYFYLMKEGDCIPDLPSNAIPVYYGSEYCELPPFLDELSSYRLRNRTETKALVQIDPYTSPKQVVSAFGRMHFANRFSSFVGRQSEQDRLNRFLYANGAVLWWGILGKGGIGKSRLILEWLKILPADWYGFFARKDPGRFANFVPFTNTVIVLDYILGEEEQSAQTIATLMRQFGASHYQLRLLLIERRQDCDTEDWLAKLNRLLRPEDRLMFESCRYLAGAASADVAEFMHLEPLDDEDELHYIQSYLRAYVPAFLEPAAADVYLSDLDTVGKTIQSFYRDALEEVNRRPLYLSIYTEVWINKAGSVDIKGAKQLLKVYLEKETDRWKSLLKEDQLVTAYLKLLAMACITEQFNITDVQGNNYLRKECDLLSAFLDEQDSRPGKQSAFNDLFVMQDELEEFDFEDSMIFKAYGRLSQNDAPSQDEDYAQDKGIPRDEREGMKLSQDERFAFLMPYIKLEADPEEFYLHLLNGVGGLSEEEAARLAQLQEERTQATTSLPDYAWIIAPAFPDIIREYLVLYVLKPRDIVPFTKLARANSVYSLGQFLTRAVEDWPEESCFEKMLATPPENVIEYFEFYIPWLADAREIKSFRPLEELLLQGEATLLFARYEMEMWYRIAIVLTEREDWDRLLDSAGQFIQYALGACDHPKVRERVVEVLDCYAVGLHNAEEAEKLELFLNQCDGLAETWPDKPQLALFCCDKRGMLIHLWRYLKHTETIERDWRVVVGYLTSYPQDRDICLSAMHTVNEYFSWCQREKTDIYQQTKNLAELLENVFREHPILAVAEPLAIVMANLYMFTLDKTQKHSEELFQKIQRIFTQFPTSKKTRSAYASVCGKKYAVKENWAHDVPRKIIDRLKKWNAQYPDEIEFQEALFDVTIFHLGYAREHGQRREELRSFHELEQIAQTANYQDYCEENHLKKRVDLLRRILNYESKPR